MSQLSSCLAKPRLLEHTAALWRCHLASCYLLQHKRTCRRLLKHLPMIDNGEVEVDSLLVHNTEVIYKCSAVCVLQGCGKGRDAFRDSFFHCGSGLASS